MKPMSIKKHILLFALPLALIGAANAQELTFDTQEVPATTALPPMELQTGGQELFGGLVPVNEVIAPLTTNRGDRIFVNQKFNLNKIGPGTNLIFVTDTGGSVAGFAVSNGRFDSAETNGAVQDNTYPLKDSLAGKYPWPMSKPDQEKSTQYLQGDKLVTSNGPHGSIENALNAFVESSSSIAADSLYIGGHLGRNLQGELGKSEKKTTGHYLLLIERNFIRLWAYGLKEKACKSYSIKRPLKL